MKDRSEVLQCLAVLVIVVGGYKPGYVIFCMDRTGREFTGTVRLQRMNALTKWRPRRDHVPFMRAVPYLPMYAGLLHSVHGIDCWRPWNYSRVRQPLLKYTRSRFSFRVAYNKKRSIIEQSTRRMQSVQEGRRVRCWSVRIRSPTPNSGPIRI